MRYDDFTIQSESYRKDFWNKMMKGQTAPYETMNKGAISSDTYVLPYDSNRKYMDVQIDLEGAECFKTTPGETVPAGEFDVEGDKGYCHEAPGNDDLLDGTLEGGRFAVFMIGEPHMPNLVVPGQEVGPIKKICFKVVGDQYWDEV